MKFGKKVVKFILWLMVIVSILAASLFYLLYKNQPQYLSNPIINTTPPVIIESITKPAVLVFSKTNGYRHKEAINAGKLMFSEFAKSHGWSVYFSENAAIYNDDQLAKFDVVVWNCATQPALTAEQQQAFKSFVLMGGGFVGIHGAGDNSHKEWPWYQQTLIGATFIGHPMFPQFQTATVNVERSDHPVMLGIPVSWSHEDEWYSFLNSPRAKGVTILATIDETTYNPKRSLSGRSLAMGADHPIIWSQTLGEGRAVYSALGHQAKTFDDPTFRKIIEQSVRWAGRFD